MNAQGTFEVVRDADGWYWQLHDGEVTLAVGDERHPTSATARATIDRVRDATASLSNLDEDEFEFADASMDDAGVELRTRTNGEVGKVRWVLSVDGDDVAVSDLSFTSAQSARESMRRFRTLATGSVPVFLVGAEADLSYKPFEVGKSSIRGVTSLLGRGRRHRSYLEDIETRIVVSGIRGKSSTVKRLTDVFSRRGYDTMTKVTGNKPVIVRNGEVIPIKRTGAYTTLYENINIVREFGPELAAYTPDDVAIFENQGITEYTTRLINERFVKPHVVVIANVRQDHQDTLGKTPRDLARAFARTIPEGTTVVNGEQNPVLAEYMREEIEQQGGRVEQVDIPEAQRDRIGAETVYAVNGVLDALEMDPVPEAQLNSYLDAMQPQWTRLPNGRVFNGAEINDIESTEAVRQALAGDDLILPFVYLRADRRSRTASFAKYLNTLADRGLIERARAGGAFTDVFADNVDVPVTRHRRTEDAAAVLDEMLEEGYPVVTMGNTVDDFMRDLEDEISVRANTAAVESAD